MDDPGPIPPPPPTPRTLILFRRIVASTCACFHIGVETNHFEKCEHLYLPWYPTTSTHTHGADGHYLWVYVKTNNTGLINLVQFIRYRASRNKREVGHLQRKK